MQSFATAEQAMQLKGTTRRNMTLLNTYLRNTSRNYPQHIINTVKPERGTKTILEIHQTNRMERHPF